MGDNTPTNKGDGIHIDVSNFSSGLGNSFQAIYKLIGVDQYNKETSVYARAIDTSKTLTEIKVRGLTSIAVETDINIVYSNTSDVFTEIHPSVYHMMPTDIYIRPNNSMVALYEVRQPPIITDIFNPTQDSFTRANPSFQAINYGGSSSMVVGKTPSEQWRSILQFDMGILKSSYILTESYLRLYYRNAPPNTISIDVFQANDKWEEFNITELNRPQPFNLITDKFTVNEQAGYIEFDVFKVVESMVSGFTVNNGFMLQVSDGVTNDQAIFYTRETSLPPELVIKYYDSTIFSFGRNQLNTEIYIKIQKDSDKFTDLIVKSDYDASIVDTDLYVHRAEDPIFLEALTEVTVVRKDILTELVARLGDYREVDTFIYVKVDKEELLPTEIFVNRKEMYTFIKVAHSGESNIPTEVSVTRDNILTTIIASFSRTSGEENLLTEIKVVTSRVENLDTNIFVNRKNVETELTVTLWEESEINTEIYVHKSRILTEVLISKHTQVTDLRVRGRLYSSVDTEIYVAYTSNVPTEIDIKAVNQILTEIDVIGSSRKLTELAVSRDSIITELMVPYWDISDTPTEIHARGFMVNDMTTYLFIGDKVGAYAFII